MPDLVSPDITAKGAPVRSPNFWLGLAAGLVAAVLGALLWMLVEVALKMQIGFVALAIGALVGFAVRAAGNGRGPAFGILGAVLTLFGCLGGQILAILYLESTPEEGMLAVLAHADLVDMVSLIFSHMSPISYLIYGVGIYEGYKLSMRKV